MAVTEIDFNKLESAESMIGQMLLKRVERGHRVSSELCPVDTGRMRADLHFGLGRDEHGLFGFIGTDVDYSRPNELGTWFMPARPFLRPGLAAAAA